MFKKHIIMAMTASVLFVSSPAAFSSATIMFKAQIVEGGCNSNQTMVTCYRSGQTKKQNQPVDLQKMIKNNVSEFEHNGSLFKIKKIDHKNYLVQIHEN